MPDLNIFNLDFGNLAKSLNKGRIDKVYLKMYKVAQRLTSEDFKRFQLELLAKSNKFKDTRDLTMTLSDFFKDRIEFHMNEMKQLLEKSLKVQSKDK